MTATGAPVAFLACGALARETAELVRRNIQKSLALDALAVELRSR